jgi:hypothetical protein
MSRLAFVALHPKVLFLAFILKNQEERPDTIALAIALLEPADGEARLVTQVYFGHIDPKLCNITIADTEIIS